MCGMTTSCRRWRRFAFFRLRVLYLVLAHEIFDEVHIFLNDLLGDTSALQCTKKCCPRWIDALRCKSVFSIVSHMSNMNKGS